MNEIAAAWIIASDTGDHTQAEYMLMGTFLSLAITLAVGLTVNWLLGQL